MPRIRMTSLIYGPFPSPRGVDMKSRWLVGCAATALTLTACSDDGGGSIQPIPDQGASTEAPEDLDQDDTSAEADKIDDVGEPDDPFALPDEIDEEYLQRVADELMAIRTAILRRAIIANESGDAQDQEAISLIGSLYTGIGTLEPNLNEFSDQVRSTGLDELYRRADDLNPEHLSVVEAFDAQNGCAVFSAEYDNSGVLLQPNDRDPYFIIVLEHQPDAEDINVTGWKIRDEQRLVSGEDEALATREQVEALDAETVDGIIENPCRAGEDHE